MKAELLPEGVRIVSAIVGVLVALVGIWALGSALAWVNASLESSAIVVTTVVLVVALLAGVAVGLRFRNRSRTTYW